MSEYHNPTYEHGLDSIEEEKDLQTSSISKELKTMGKRFKELVSSKEMQGMDIHTLNTKRCSKKSLNMENLGSGIKIASIEGT